MRGKKNNETTFWQRVNKTVDCWEWTGQLTIHDYGTISWNGKNISTHRISWIFKNGKIEDGLCVLHKCDNRRCVNPDHLFLGTHIDNMRDMKIKNRGGKFNSLKTHCPSGHPYVESNTYLKKTKNGGPNRQCAKCFSIYAKKKNSTKEAKKKSSRKWKEFYSNPQNREKYLLKRRLAEQKRRNEK